MKTLETITDDMAGFICKEICKVNMLKLDEDEQIHICCECGLSKYISDIQDYEQGAEEQNKALARKIQKIADVYGYESQSAQMQEEAAELIQAINKLRRANGTGQMCGKTAYQAKHELIEELADVEIMIRQMVYLLDCNVLFQEFVEDKTSRTLLRIAEKNL